MTTYGTTPAGFVRKPLDVILDEVATQQRATIDPLLNTDSDSVVGQLNGIYGDQIAELWENQEALYYALSRLSDGDALDVIGALNGTPRKGATKSTVVLTLGLASSTTVPAGSIVSVNGNPSIRVVTTADVSTGGSPASVFVAAAAETAGAITANPFTLTTIATPIAGWLTATNAASLTGGRDIENDDDYRLRQIAELAVAGGATVAGIRADLLKVANVLAAEVLENDADTANSDGMPGHSVEAIVQGGADADIASTLFGSKAGGIYAHGSTGPITVVGDDGVSHDVRFTRPTARPVYIAIGLKTTTDWHGFAPPVIAAILGASIAPSNPGYLSIGSTVYASHILLTALGIDGVVDARVGLSFSTLTDPALGSLTLAIGSREIATLLDIHISVSSL